MSSQRPAPSSSTLSREEAERYARRFVPVWQSSTGEPTAEIAIRDIPPPDDLPDTHDAPVDLDGVLRRSVSPWVWVAIAVSLVAGGWAVKSALRPASEFVRSSPSGESPSTTAQREGQQKRAVGVLDEANPRSNAEPSTEPSAEPSTDSVPAPAKSTVRIEVDPPGARLLLDEAAVSSPFEGELSLGSVHRVRAEAEGFQTKQLQFVVTENRVVRLWLTRVATTTASTEDSTKPADRESTGADDGKAAAAPDKPARNRNRANAERIKPAPKTASKTANKPAKRPPPAGPAARPAGAGFVTDNPY